MTRKVLVRPVDDGDGSAAHDEMTALQMLTVWGGVAVVCLAGIVIALMTLLRAREDAPDAARGEVAKPSAKLDSAPTIGT
jgi:hypothetical protein